MRHTALLFVLFALGSGLSTAIAQETHQSAKSPDECVAIIGAVIAPARLELKRQIRLREAITIVGGLTKNAGSTIEIRPSGTRCPPESFASDRSSIPAKVRVYQTIGIQSDDETQNPYLEAGDLVVVSERDPVFIVGAIAQPQQILLEGRLTLTQAIAHAGGLRKEAQPEKVRIYRQPKGSDQRLELMVNLKKIRKKRAEDPVLQPYDIIEVPGLKPKGPMFSVVNRELPSDVMDRVIY